MCRNFPKVFPLSVELLPTFAPQFCYLYPRELLHRVKPEVGWAMNKNASDLRASLRFITSKRALRRAVIAERFPEASVRHSIDDRLDQFDPIPTIAAQRVQRRTRAFLKRTWRPYADRGGQEQFGDRRADVLVLSYGGCLRARKLSKVWCK